MNNVKIVNTVFFIFFKTRLSTKISKILNNKRDCSINCVYFESLITFD